MAKRSQRHSMRYEKDQAGCVWAFINIFDFRHGRSTRKLLSDRRHTRRQVVGARYSGSKMGMPTNSKEDSKEIYGCEESHASTADDGKSSVKELMKEEMISEQVPKQLMTCADIEAKECDSGHRGQIKRNRKQTSKTNKSSCDVHYELDATKSLGLENSFCQDSEEKISKNLDVEVLLNELYQQINQKSTTCMNHDWGNDPIIQSEQELSVSDKKLMEAIKVFVDQTFAEGKHLREDGDIDCSDQYTDALQTLSSNKRSILKLLKDRNSLLVRHIEDLDGAHVETDQNSYSPSGSHFLDGELSKSKPSEAVARKQHSFFRRRSKSQEKILLQADKNSQTSNRIVILKPAPASLQTSETEIKHHLSGPKVQTERTVSQFSFTEIRRKLKHAMGKEQYRVPLEKGIQRERGAWNSPYRNHFYNEKFASTAFHTKNKEKNWKRRDFETGMRNEIDEYNRLTVSNINIEAKKHLAEMLKNGEEIADISSRILPKTLGRILSLPEFNFSPTCSPGSEKEHGLVTTERQSPCSKNLQTVNEDSWQLAHENCDSSLHPLQPMLNSQLCLADNPEGSLQSCELNSDVGHENTCANAMEETLFSMRAERSSGGDEEITETSDASVQGESNLDISAKQFSSSVDRGDQQSDPAEVCDKDDYAQCLGSDSLEQNQLMPSPIKSPPSSCTTKDVGDIDNAKERTEQPSPVSVLEPLFMEDEISPASIKFQSVEPPMMPLQFHFEERLSYTASQEICIGACLEGEESAFEYVEAVLLASDLNWEEYILRWLSSNQVLGTSLFEEVGLFSNRSCNDQKLLFDCTNEVLEQVCERYFGYSPRVSSVKRNNQTIPRGKDLIDEVWNEVERHLLPQPSPSTLDLLIKKDVAYSGTWTDLQFDVKSIGSDVQEAIFEDLLNNTLLCLVDEGPRIDSMTLKQLI
ncbi:uncharacterized protein LOC127801200 [Diospyros lotus]|uniref:uncharacterized protein LOC127801200 n=1 Tax=Diospyros lotus TaxID=55363 RepID=UPI002259BCC1|nr:uncharacterized protein LOC127801200 [Diospyros lotus]